MPRNDRSSDKPKTRQARARKRAYVSSKITEAHKRRNKEPKS